MKKQVFTVEKDGFNGVWYANPVPGKRGVILMLGDSAEDRMAVCGAKWLHENGCHVMDMSPDKKDYGHHNYPLERFEKAIRYMKQQGCEKLGVIGASTTGMLALVAASYYPELTLTVAFSPSDFVMEGFYQDGKDGMRERPGNGESSVSWRGEGLPYLPYAYRHGTHFAFPESMLKMMLPVGSDLLVRIMFRAAKEHPKECRDTRIDIDRRLRQAFCDWRSEE